MPNGYHSQSSAIHLILFIFRFDFHSLLNVMGDNIFHMRLSHNLFMHTKQQQQQRFLRQQQQQRYMKIENKAKWNGWDWVTRTQNILPFQHLSFPMAFRNSDFHVSNSSQQHHLHHYRQQSIATYSHSVDIFVCSLQMQEFKVMTHDKHFCLYTLNRNCSCLVLLIFHWIDCG